MMNRTHCPVLAPMLTLLFFAACATPGAVSVEPTSPASPRKEPARGAATPERVTGTPATAEPAAAPVEIQLFLMSKCPFGVQALERLFPAVESLGPRVKLKLDYIVSEQDGGFKSLHGEPEITGNKQQLCAMELALTPTAWRRFIRCQNRTWRAIPAGWETCADDAGLKREAFKACVDGAQGDALLRASMERSLAAKAQGSPTILVGGKRYQGPRTARAFLRTACATAPSPPPMACKELPPEIEVQLVVLSDRRCGKRCETVEVVEALRGRFFPRLKVTRMDYADADGQRLFKQLALERLPAILFKAGVERAEAYPRIERWLQLRGTYRSLKVPARFDPTAEICDNGVDDTKDGKVDCADPACQRDLTCRKEKPGRLDLFVMSQCPYGVKALDAMKKVLPHFKGKLKFRVHYIAEERKDGSFSALHGQPEVEENIRQLCAYKLYPRKDQYLRYIWCRNGDIRSDQWRRCADTGNMSARRLGLCVKREGTRLLAKDIRLAKTLEVRASPTWLVNNRHKFSGISAEAIRLHVCKHNPVLKGCDTSLGGQDVQPAPGACGASGGDKEPDREQGAGEDAVPAGPEAYKVGVPSCDDYIQKFLRCVRSKMPADTRPLLERSLLVTARKWRAVKVSGKGTAELAAGCDAALRDARTALKEYGCTW